MSEQALTLLDTVLAASGYHTEFPDDRIGVLGEDETRIVWAAAFPGVTALLDGWEEEQAWLVTRATDRVSTEKSWELYLVLACEAEPDEYEAQAIEGIRRDVSYARKLVVTGAGHMSPSRLRDRLAALDTLVLRQGAEPVDALAVLEEAAVAESNSDALTVLASYRANRPLFGDL
jgi:hypothetical protein